MYQENIIRKELERIKAKNYILTGGYSEAESKILIMYPEKITEEIAKENITNIIKVIRYNYQTSKKANINTGII